MVNCCCLCRTVSTWLPHNIWPISILSGTTWWIWSCWRHWHYWRRPQCLVCTTSTLLQLYPLPHWLNGWFSSSQTSLSCLLQHIQANQPDPRKLHAEVGHSHAVRMGCQSSANTLCLPCGECSWTSASPVMLLEGQHGQYHPTQLQVSNSKGSCCWISADYRPDSGTGSRLFEVNIWMWKYGRPFPRKSSVGLLPQKWACQGNERD